MTNVYPIQAAINPAAAFDGQGAFQDAFQDKVVPPRYVEKKAWVVHGPSGSGRTTLANALYNDRRCVVQHAFNNTVFISAGLMGYAVASRALNTALDEGYSLFLDVPADAVLLQDLKQRGYHTRFISVYAPLQLCANRLLERDGDLRTDLIEARINALQAFNGMAAVADTFTVRYAHAAKDPVVEAMYVGSERSAVYTGRKVLVSDRAVVARLLRDLRGEGGRDQLAALRPTLGVTDADREALNHQGRLMAETIARWAGPAGRLSLAPRHV